jgi:hypothetical protein
MNLKQEQKDVYEENAMSVSTLNRKFILTSACTHSGKLKENAKNEK